MRRKLLTLLVFLPPRKPWSRRTVNHNVHRLIAIFKWAASHEYVPSSVYERLKTVPALRKGATAASEAAILFREEVAHAPEIWRADTDNIYVLYAMGVFGRVLDMLGEHVEAERFASWSFEGRKRVFGAASPDPMRTIQRCRVAAAGSP